MQIHPVRQPGKMLIHILSTSKDSIVYYQDFVIIWSLALRGKWERSHCQKQVRFSGAFPNGFSCQFNPACPPTGGRYQRSWRPNRKSEYQQDCCLFKLYERAPPALCMLLYIKNLHEGDLGMAVCWTISLANTQTGQPFIADLSRMLHFDENSVFIQDFLCSIPEFLKALAFRSVLFPAFP